MLVLAGQETPLRRACAHRTAAHRTESANCGTHIRCHRPGFAARTPVPIALEHRRRSSCSYLRLLLTPASRTVESCTRSQGGSFAQLLTAPDVTFKGPTFQNRYTRMIGAPGSLTTSVMQSGHPAVIVPGVLGRGCDRGQLGTQPTTGSAQPPTHSEEASRPDDRVDGQDRDDPGQAGGVG